MADQQATLSAQSRAETGKGANRQLRRQGLLPAVVYGHGDATKALTLSAHEFERLMSRIHAATTVIGLQLEGDDSRQVLIREVQRHPYRREVMHVDFFHIREDEKIKVQVPLHLEGLAKGVDLGGIMQQIRHVLEVECLPGDIPSDFSVDVSAMDVGDSIHIGDIDAKGAVILDDADLTVCTVVPPTVEEVPEEEEELEEGMELEEGVEGEPTAEGEVERQEGEGSGE